MAELASETGTGDRTQTSQLTLFAKHGHLAIYSLQTRRKDKHGLNLHLFGVTVESAL